jgi:hypothetical protein
MLIYTNLRSIRGRIAGAPADQAPASASPAKPK